MTDAFIGQIFTANNEKQHTLRKHKACNGQISTKLLFPRNEYETYSQIFIWKICSPKNMPYQYYVDIPAFDINHDVSKNAIQ